MKHSLKFGQILIFFKDGCWILEKNEKTYNLNADNLEDPFIIWLPLLEVDYFEFRDQLSFFGREYFLFFPTLSLVKQGLKSNSLHWINLSIRWLKDIKFDSSINKILIDLLKSSSKLSQSTKHEIQKLIKSTTSL